MAKPKLDFVAVDLSSLPQEIIDNLAVIDQAKLEINQTLAKLRGEGWKAQHSYKLDFKEGKKSFKVAFWKAAAAKADGVQKLTLAEMLAGAQADGRSH